MTIISLKHNRYNLVTQRMNWQKKNSKVLNSRFSFVAFLNIGLMILIIFTIVGSLFLEIKMVNYRFDIKNLTSQSVVFEQKNAELKNQVASLQSFDKFTAIAEKESLILVAVPGYFSLVKNPQMEVGLTNLNNL
jgi:cell division protein FtsL